MKTILLLVALAALANASTEWSSLHVKWSLLDIFRLNSFYEIPMNESAAIADGSWVLVDNVSNIEQVSCYCMEDDPRFCVYFDSYGNAAGFQVGVLYSDLEDDGCPYDLSSISMYVLKEMFGEQVWTSSVYTVNPETLEAGGREDAEGVLGTEGVWVLNNDDTYWTIPRYATDLVEKGYVEEYCVSKMGTHYYYNMSSSLDCMEFSPFFALVDNTTKEVTGLGFQGFGPAEAYKRQWYESVPSLFILGTIKDYPTCLLDWSYDYGAISVHIYFTPEPWDISC